MKTSGKIQMALALAGLAAVPVAASAATTELVQLQVNGGTIASFNGSGTLVVPSGTTSGGVSFSGPNVSTRGPTTILNDDTLAVTNSSGSAANITILLSDFNFAPTGTVVGSPTLYNTLHGTYLPLTSTGSASASVISYVDPNNSQITLSNYSSLTNTGPSSASGITSSPFNGSTSSVVYTLGSGDFSLAQIATLVLPAGAQITLGSTTVTNVPTIASPEPASLALVGAAGLPLLLLRRRKGAAA